MKAELKKELAEAVEIVFPTKGGLYLWLKFVKNVDSKKLYQQAVAKGLVFSPGYLFSLNSDFGNHLRLSFAAVDSQEIKRGVQILKEIYLNHAHLNQKTEQEYSPLI